MNLLPDWQPYGNIDPVELDRLANQLLIATVLLMIGPLGGSLARFPDTGWLSIYTIQAILYGLVVLVFLLRNLLDTRIKAGFLVLAYFIVPAMGHYALGQLKGGVMYLPIAIVIAVFFFSPKVVAALALTGFLGLFYIANAFISGDLVSAIPLEVANTSLAQWANYSFSFLAFSVMLGIIMFGYRNILASKVSETEKQRDEILYFKDHDQLTGAATLNLAMEELQAAIQEAEAKGHKGGLLLIRLENLEEIYDQENLDAGESILKLASERIASLMRPEDVLARVGSSRFLVVIPVLKKAGRAEFLAQMILEKFEQPFRADLKDIFVRCRIGITTFSSESLEPEQLLQRANTAWFRANKAHTSTFFLD